MTRLHRQLYLAAIGVVIILGVWVLGWVWRGFLSNFLCQPSDYATVFAGEKQ